MRSDGIGVMRNRVETTHELPRSTLCSDDPLLTTHETSHCTSLSIAHIHIQQTKSQPRAESLSTQLRTFHLYSYIPPTASVSLSLSAFLPRRRCTTGNRTCTATTERPDSAQTRLPPRNGCERHDSMSHACDRFDPDTVFAQRVCKGKVDKRFGVEQHRRCNTVVQQQKDRAGAFSRKVIGQSVQ